MPDGQQMTEEEKQRQHDLELVKPLVSFLSNQGRTVGMSDEDYYLAVVATMRNIVHDELASLGGSLLKQYGQPPANADRYQSRLALGSLGGDLLATYGKKS